MYQNLRLNEEPEFLVRMLFMTGLHNKTEIGQGSFTAFKMCKINNMEIMVCLDVAQCSLVDVQ